MNPSWTDVVQAICSLGALIVAVVGFVALIFQVRQLERAIRGDTHSKLYEQGLATVQLVFEAPNLWPYVYEGKETAPGDPDYFQLCALVEIIADFHEHIALQKPNLPPAVWQRWRDYLRETTRTCPTLRDHYRRRAPWYLQEILGLVSEGDARTNEVAEQIAPGNAG